MIDYNMVEREAKRVAFHILHMKKFDELIAKVEYDINTNKETAHFQYRNKSVSIELPEKFSKTISIDDLSELHIKPAIMKLADWERAFKLETYL